MVRSKWMAAWLVSAMLLTTAGSLDAATWSYQATSGWTLLAPDPGVTDEIQNWNHVKRWDMVVDPSGNVFACAGDGRNFDTLLASYKPSPGGVTIFKPDGLGGWTKVDIDLTHTGLDLPGGITKMVVGGDGKVYALQNWHPPGNNWSWYPHWMLTDGSATLGCTTCNMHSRILRINLDGTVDVIAEQTPPVLRNENWINMYGGLTVGGDGHVYFWLAGAQFGLSTFWREHVLWRYNVINQVVEESPTAGFNNGWEWIPFFHNLAYVGTSPNGTMWLCPMIGIYVYSADWGPSAMAWNINRMIADGYNPATYVSDSRNDPLMELAYDPIFNKLWTCARGKGNVATNSSSIVYRFNGDPNKPALFDDPVAVAPQTGVVSDDKWHANANAPDISGIPNNGQYWVTDLAINPADGSAWMSWGSDANYYFAGPYGPVGSIYTVGPSDTGPTGNEGNPQTAHSDPNKADNVSQTLAIAFAGTQIYALTFDLEAREFNLFTAPNTTAVPGACCTVSGCVEGITQGQCLGQGGAWQGDNSTCAQTDCTFQVCSNPFADADADGDVDQVDFGVFQSCYAVNPPGGFSLPTYPPVNCSCYDTDGSGVVDETDFQAFNLCFSGPGVPANPACDD